MSLLRNTVARFHGIQWRTPSPRAPRRSPERNLSPTGLGQHPAPLAHWFSSSTVSPTNYNRTNYTHRLGSRPFAFTGGQADYISLYQHTLTSQPRRLQDGSSAGKFDHRQVCPLWHRQADFSILRAVGQSLRTTVLLSWCSNRTKAYSTCTHGSGGGPR